jgi:hypothetical protein
MDDYVLSALNFVKQEIQFTIKYRFLKKHHELKNDKNTPCWCNLVTSDCECSSIKFFLVVFFPVEDPKIYVNKLFYDNYPH